MKANIVKRTLAGMTAVISAASTIPAMSMGTVFADDNNTPIVTKDPVGNNDGGENEGNNDGDVVTYDAKWTWTKLEAGGYQADVTIEGSDNSSVTYEGVTVEKETILEATENRPAAVKYTAKVIHNEKTFVDVKYDHSYVVKNWSWDTDPEEPDWAVAKLISEDTTAEPVSIKVKPAKIETPATCEKDGKIEYKATVEYNGQTFEDLREYATLPALGHDYQYTYKWEPVLDEKGNEVTKKCTATRICKNDKTGEETVIEEGTVTAEVTVEPTAVEQGEKVYTATFENEIFETQTNTVVLGVVDAEYDTFRYVWSEDYSTCTGYAYSNNGGKDIIEVVERDGEGLVVKEATCEEGGQVEYKTKEFKDSHFTSQVITVDTPALGHSYKNVVTPEFFTDDDGNAYATFVCDRGDHEETVPAEVTEEVTQEPTCSVPGKKTVKYTVEFEGKTYEQEIENVEIPKLGHTLTIKWYWDGITTDAEGKITDTENKVYCSVVARCTTCDESWFEGGEIKEEITDSTCYAEGLATYTAKVTIDGETYTDVKSYVIAKKPHTFGPATYNWNSDYTICTSTRKCTTCPKGKEEVETEITENITSKIIQTATTQRSGKIRYTATFEDGTTTTRDVVIPKVTPNYKDPEYKWTETEDGFTCTAVKECINGTEEDNITAEATVTSAITKAATCGAEGELTYTATFADAATFPAVTKVVTIPATGEHKFGYPIWTWTPNDNGGYDASVLRMCEVCGEIESYDVEVTSNDGGDGYMYYFATAKINGVEVGSLNKVKKSANPVVTATPDVESVTLNWKPVDKAEKYGVCGVQKDGSWKMLDMGTDTTFTIKNLKYGTDYMVAVIAMFDGKWNMDFSNAITVTPLENLVPTVSYEAGVGYADISWTEVQSAAGYGIMAEVDGEWKLIDSGKGTTYKLKGLNPDKEYKIAVIANVDGKWNKDYSNAITVKCNPEQQTTSVYPKITNIEYNETYHQFRVTWEGVENAEAYGIAYFAANKWRAYGNPISPKLNTWTSPKLTAGKQCKFAIVAKVNGKWNLSKIEARASSITIK